MTLIDTNVLIRHVTRDPPEQAERATDFLENEHEFFCPDVVLAEFFYILKSRYALSRQRCAAAALSVLGIENLFVADDALLVRAIGIYEQHRVDFEDAYLVALAEREGIRQIVSFDRDFDRIPEIERVEP
ncbi:MAG: type II toxin-antitoxin system VapC family toxin [Actinomycetota bacterium]